MEKLLVETNIVIDLLSKREEFFQEAQESMQLIYKLLSLLQLKKNISND